MQKNSPCEYIFIIMSIYLKIIQCAAVLSTAGV